MNITENKRTIANFLRFENMSFPLECNGMSDSQLNDALLSVLGNIGGDKYILSGLNTNSGNAGYVFLATNDFPSGELLFVEPAAAMTSHLCLRKTNEDVSANGFPYIGAYTKRTLFHGVPSAGVESFARSGFTPLETNASLKSRLDTLTNKVNEMQPTPVGAIIMWTNTVMPSNQWLPCDGRLISKTTYSALYGIFDANKFGADTASEFHLPNMQGRFPLMVGGNTNASIAGTGGAESHTLTPGQIPAHTHIQRVSPEYGTAEIRQGFRIDTDPPNIVGTTNQDKISLVPWISKPGGSGDGDDYVHTLNNTGGGNAHNNMPPYMGLNFIIKAL